MSNITQISINNTDYDIRDGSISDWARASSRPTYTAQDVGALPSTTVIPTTVQQLNVIVGTEDPSTINPTTKGWANGTLYFYIKP